MIKVNRDEGARELDKHLTEKQKGITKKLGMFKMVKLQKLGLKLYGKLCPECRERIHLNPYHPELCGKCSLDNEDLIKQIADLQED